MRNRAGVDETVSLRQRSLFASGLLLSISVLLSFAGSPTGLRAQDPELDVLIELLAEVDDDELRLELLTGLAEGLRGRTRVAMPAGWKRAYEALSKSSNVEIRERALSIALVFDDPAALASLKRTLVDAKAPLASRRRALEALVEKRVDGLATALQDLLVDTNMRRPALRALAAYEHGATPRRILALYPDFDRESKDDAISTLASRPRFAIALLKAVKKGVVERGDVTAIHARKIEGLGDETARKLLREVWGDIRSTSAEKREAIAKYKELLRPAFLASAALPNGRRLFEATCAKCHTLYGAGGDIGPELTGSNRADLDYILENILDPSAAIGRDYRLSTAVTRDGRVLAGIVKERREGRVTIQTENELVILAENELVALEESPASMMPDGLLTNLSRTQVRDLIAYLASSSQVPLPDADTETSEKTDTTANDTTESEPTRNR